VTDIVAVELGERLQQSGGQATEEMLTQLLIEACRAPAQ
jgi:hypothetical protein